MMTANDYRRLQRQRAVLADDFEQWATAVECDNYGRLPLSQTLAWGYLSLGDGNKRAYCPHAE